MLGAPGRPRTRRRSRPDIPKDYLEAFGNIYTEPADAIDAAHAGHTPAGVLTPGIDYGVKGLAFIEAAGLHHKPERSGYP